MDRATIVELLPTNLPELKRKYAVQRLAEFESATRDESRTDSDMIASAEKIARFVEGKSAESCSEHAPALLAAARVLWEREDTEHES